MERIQYTPAANSGYEELAHFLVEKSKRNWVINTWIKQAGNLNRLTKAIETKLIAEKIKLLDNVTISVVAELGYYLSALKLVAGTLHIAWTVDDGPTNFTRKMAANFLLKGKNRPATWFIVRDRLTAKNIGIYKDLQSRGHEIAIHGLHETNNHLSWLPSASIDSYKDFNEALLDLGKFQKELNSQGLRTRFVRLPYGLFTELVHSLKIKGMKKNVMTTARNIVKQKISPKGAAPANMVADEFNKLRNKLKDLGLILWGGSNNGSISNNSWEFESASKKTSRGKNDFDVKKGSKVFNLIQGINKRKSKSASMVILCHDTSSGDVMEVQKDLLDIEKLAADAGVKIKYHTMSSLYKQIVSG
jgi:peptidoglycan/xylan/chitin deacetylase (PgdA/CDA1 family)